jgi:hypothetical protein
MKIAFVVITSLLTPLLIIALTKLLLVLRPISKKDYQGDKPKQKSCPAHTDPDVPHILRRNEIPNKKERERDSQSHDRPDKYSQPSSLTKHTKRIIGRSKRVSTETEENPRGTVREVRFLLVFGYIPHKPLVVGSNPSAATCFVSNSAKSAYVQSSTIWTIVSFR